MNIAIVHYHLNRGGVTRVIANQLLSLDGELERDEPCRAAILFGGRSQGWPNDVTDRLESIDLQLCPLPSLDYDDRPVDRSDVLAGEIRELLRRLEFAPGETLLHVHNHSLGKNVSLSGAIRRLAEDGFPLLLQIHDFAEDFRPVGYRLLADTLGSDVLATTLYPQADHVHYAVLNRRDQTILQAGGVDSSNLHFLPNPVPDLGPLPDRTAARSKLLDRFGIPAERPFVLYPVRGIRRKNFGEALLWSVLMGAHADFGFTLEPLNPAEQPAYRQWKNLAAELDLPCHFETGGETGLTFEENLSASDLILTTSVAEGFGMVFLESWLAGRPLTGRNLPEVTTDFTEAGIRFDNLYDRFEIPVEWIDLDYFLQAIESTYAKVTKQYGSPPADRSTIERAVEAKVLNGSVDFADLDVPLQQAVIRRAHADVLARQELCQLNPVVERLLSGESELVEHNRRVVQQTYSLRASGNRLKTVYSDVLSSERSASITAPSAGDKILDGFLDLNRLRLIRG